ncbi:MAG: hypothetical protein Q9228_007999, partial [Teloschistes exilis]
IPIDSHTEGNLNIPARRVRGPRLRGWLQITPTERDHLAGCNHGLRWQSLGQSFGGGLEVRL